MIGVGLTPCDRIIRSRLFRFISPEMLELYLSLLQWDDDRGELYGFLRRSH